MHADEFRDRVETQTATELGRLGSDKYLIAATGADLSEPAVLRTVAATAASGRETFEAWAAAAEGPAAETFADAAATERDHYDRTVERLDDPSVDHEDAVHGALASAETTVERAGALVGRALVCDRTHLQVVNFFVNEGDESSAEFARGLRADANAQADAGVSVLASVCADDEDWASAETAATAVISAAYDAYADALESMGVDPKPVC